MCVMQVRQELGVDLQLIMRGYFIYPQVHRCLLLTRKTEV